MKPISNKIRLLLIMCAASLAMTACQSTSDSSSKSSKETNSIATVSQTDSNADSNETSGTDSSAETTIDSETDSETESEPASSETDDSTATPDPLAEEEYTGSVFIDNPLKDKTYEIKDANGTSSEHKTLAGHKPFFTEEEIKKAEDCIANGTKYFGDSNESYSELDELGRPGVAMALLSKETMPAEGETRGPIGMIKPAGWRTIKYPDLINDLYLYNRCHLIGWQLGAENANEKNLITGTRQLNVEGMLPFENEVADYISQNDTHVLYRVTPIYIGNELICRGVLIEAKSIEDTAVNICEFCYNVQQFIKIDYRNGDSYAIENPETMEKVDTTVDTTETAESTFIVNANSHKIHLPDCESVSKMADKNKVEITGTLDDALSVYEDCSPCEICHPEEAK